MRFSILAAVVTSLAATPALAQADTAPPPPLTVTSGATLISDYRFRGVTQTDGGPAIQATVNLNHASGLYVGTWASSIDGDGSTPALTGYGNAEVDLYGGYTKTLASGVGVDVGVLYYYYPNAAKGQNTDFFEPYASLSYTIGPVATKVGAAYAWGGQAGLTGFDVRGGNDDNIYGYAEASLAVPTTPITLKGHYGYSKGSLGSLNAPGTGDNSYSDWNVTAEWVGGHLKGGVSYVDTDISDRTVAGVGRFARRLGRGSTVLGYVGFAF